MRERGNVRGQLWPEGEKVGSFRKTLVTLKSRMEESPVDWKGIMKNI